MTSPEDIVRTVLSLNVGFSRLKVKRDGRLSSFIPLNFVNLTGVDATTGNSINVSVDVLTEMFFVGFGCDDYHGDQDLDGQESRAIDCAFIVYLPRKTVVVSLDVETASSLFGRSFINFYDDCLLNASDSDGLGVATDHNYGDQQWS